MDRVGVSQSTLLSLLLSSSRQPLLEELVHPLCGPQQVQSQLVLLSRYRPPKKLGATRILTTKFQGYMHRVGVRDSREIVK